ncbi:hypothetical protein A0H81_05962 [Grifola frondosa]|uniref:Uncharacterized protein n=1 Tax=Grifola frondosa TaxID=5627 RepID=A0A1C7MBA0_GRIFR|nr:hypothetical protein A0H81_05962 [Grifola frondosa]
MWATTSSKSYGVHDIDKFVVRGSSVVSCLVLPARQVRFVIFSTHFSIIMAHGLRNNMKPLRVILYSKLIFGVLRLSLGAFINNVIAFQIYPLESGINMLT